MFLPTTKTNVGPARIRNLLVEKATYDYFLLMDADTYPTHAHFLADYLEARMPNSVICGGFVYERTDNPACALRYYYGIRIEEMPVHRRNIRPYDRFISMCFLADKSVFQKVCFNEQMHFGYEDAFFGLQLEEAGIKLLHIDNPVYHRTIDDAESYLRKIRKAIQNLLPQTGNLALRIRLLCWFRKLEK